MTEQVPEGLTEAEVVDRLEVDRSEDESDGVSEVDRWKTRAATTVPAKPSGFHRHAATVSVGPDRRGVQLRGDRPEDRQCRDQCRALDLVKRASLPVDG
jgi:hypothetical protein